MSKQTMTAENLYAFLEAEFKKVRSPECSTCVVPKPFWGPSAGLGQGYWYMKTPADCPQGCRQALAQIWARVTTDYEISAPAKDTVA
jgi:hypothetical protein